LYIFGVNARRQLLAWKPTNWLEKPIYQGSNSFAIGLEWTFPTSAYLVTLSKMVEKQALIASLGR